MKQYQDYVFGYGSIVDPHKLRHFLGRVTFTPDDYTFCHLSGYRRCWNVAMNNQLDISGYKYYIEVETGHRSKVFVTFLNVRPTPDTSIAGLLFGVSPKELVQLDSRERNYQRVNISGKVSQPTSGQVWLYVGLPEAEQRFQEGIQHNSAVISRQYYHLVCDAFHSFGQAALIDYLNSTDEPTVPLQDLRPIYI